MPIVKTAELTGEALNWAVGKADGLALQIQPPQYGIGARVFEEAPSGLARYRPTVDWGQCGPLIDKYGMWLSISTAADMRHAPISAGLCTSEGWPAYGYGVDRRTAICRAVVAAVSGEAVDVPGELV